MVLDRNPDNFFAETEQVAYCPANIVPGIDFSNDPLLQGRLFSYLDTQKSRLGTANFHQLPINAPKCPVMNFQRDGQMQMNVYQGRANYEPDSLALSGEEGGARECPMTGFTTVQGRAEHDEQGDKLRVRAELFADHYSQARLFWNSMTESEQAHIASSFTFELSKVELEQVPPAWSPICVMLMRISLAALPQVSASGCRKRRRPGGKFSTLSLRRRFRFREI